MNASRALILLILVGALVSAGLALKKFGLDRDYFVYANVTCDPVVNSCFVGDGEDTPDFYSEIAKKAYLIPTCDGWADQCPELFCSPSDGDGCTQTFCEVGGEDTCSGDIPATDATDTTDTGGE